MTPEQLAIALRDHLVAEGVLLAVLHGSRARGEAGPRSDWDVAVQVGRSSDIAAVAARIAEVVGTDAVDVVDLERTSALLRYRAARDGVLLYEHGVGAFLDFRIAATLFWCDTGPVVRAAQERVLADLS